ncbi:MAG: NAD(P)-dependent oxidoreductase, partial [Spirochaetaceae bacterium]|nr:NAD(P)-dependent oxidoreductase [Spirochaetaceae bacterium]
MGVVIFGGSGFVGHWLVKALLQKGEEIIICDTVDSRSHEQARFIPCDIRKPGDFKDIPLSAKDTVVNLAANQYHHKPPRKNIQEYFFDTNTQG